MSAQANTDRLYDLLPAVYRMRDAEAGEPLRALLQVIAEQINLVEDDIAGLYDDWFIETCAEWVVPYIGDLVGFRSAAPVGLSTGGDGGRRARVVEPRREVANLVRRRRAKGTLAGLDAAARDAGGWPVFASESFGGLAIGQSVNHLHLDRHRMLHVGDALTLERLGGPFDQATWLDAAPAVDAARTRSRWGVPSVALFVWRLRAQSLTSVPAGSLDRAGNRYTFSLLGNDTQLFSPAGGGDPEAPPLEEADVPGSIERRAFDARLPSYYGPGRSLRIFLGADRTPIPGNAIVAADLSRWAYRPRAGQVAVDPARGRIAFPTRSAPRGGVWVSFYHVGDRPRLRPGQARRGHRDRRRRGVHRVTGSAATPR